MALTKAFREGRIIGPNGPLVARRAMLTRKSLLLWTGQSVLKLRRPRRVDGYDQGKISTRYGMTARERWLGRQLSPDVYLGDCALQIVFEGDDAAIRLVEGLVDGEPVVAMRALPDAHRADLWLAEREVVPAHFFPVIDALVRLHTCHDAHRQWPFGAAERPATRLVELAAKVPDAMWPDKAAFVADTLARIERTRATLEHRVMEGRVRELHAELALEHVFLELDGDVAIIDPHDGADTDRTFDVVDDIFRLVFPLEMILGRAFADEVVERYASVTMDLTLRKVATLFRRVAALRLVTDALAEATDPDEPDADALVRAEAVLNHLRAFPE